MIKVSFEDLGLADYKIAWDYQESILKKNTDIKLSNRNAEKKQETFSFNY